MATIPKVQVYEENVTVYDNEPGQASRIAVIGAFDSEVTALTSVTTARTAHSIFGTTETVGNFKGTDDIDLLFVGASELLVCNITTWSGTTAETTLTTAKLQAALAKLENEEFDILFIAEDLADASQTIVSEWLDKEFQNKYCHGQIIQMSRATASAYTDSIATINNNVYYINTQSLTVKGTQLNLNQSTAYIAGLIASMDVNRSLTAKVIPDVSGVSPEYITEQGELGNTLLNLNIPFIACRNRNKNVYYCVNSMLPDGLDLYINRVRDYVINRIAVETYLGEINSALTIAGIETIVETVREKCVNELNLLEDINYTIERESSTCVNVIINSMKFAGIITDINIYYSIEVE